MAFRHSHTWLTGVTLVPPRLKMNNRRVGQSNVSPAGEVFPVERGHRFVTRHLWCRSSLRAEVKSLTTVTLRSQAPKHQNPVTPTPHSPTSSHPPSAIPHILVILLFIALTHHILYTIPTSHLSYRRTRLSLAASYSIIPQAAKIPLQVAAA